MPLNLKVPALDSPYSFGIGPCKLISTVGGSVVNKRFSLSIALAVTCISLLLPI